MSKKIEGKQPSIAFIDRIENGVAVLILSDETTLDVPRKQLPIEAREGDYLQVTFDVKTGKATGFALDHEETANAKTRVAELQDELSADDDAAPTNIKL